MPLVALSSAEGPRLPPGAFDVRGWEVRTLVDDARVGEVHDLLLDERHVPRYLDVALGLFRKHVLIPIGSARADVKHRIVWVPGFDRARFREIPAYEHNLAGPDREYETDLVAAYSSAYASREYRPRPPVTGAVYGPPELEAPVRPRPGRIAPLSRLDQFRIAPGEPDIRGWAVVLSDGRPVGRVVDLFIDTAALKVRALECDVGAAAHRAAGNARRVVIPIGYARLDEGKRTVYVDAISSEDLDDLPVGRPGQSSGEVIERLEEPGGSGEARADDRFYDHPRFDPAEFYGWPRP